MSLLLGEPADVVRECERLRKVVERENACEPLDPVEFDDVPVGDLAMQLGDLVSGRPRSVLPTRDAPGEDPTALR